MKIVLSILILVASNSSWSYPLNEKLFRLQYGFGQNLNSGGDIRLGSGIFEMGLIQGQQVGFLFVNRTPGALFLNGGFGLNQGGALITGGGLETNTSNWFRFKADINLYLEPKNNNTQLGVSVGGVFIL